LGTFAFASGNNEQQENNQQQLNLNEQALQLFTTGTAVHCEIDKARRNINMILHSAGHLLDFAVANVNLSENWKGAKGYHFPNSPFVEYEMVSSANAAAFDAAKLQKLLQEQVDKLVSSEEEVKIQYKTVDECKAILGDSYPLPQGIDKIRMVTYGSVTCPCSGTHVKKFSELKGMKIKKLAKKKNIVRVSYEF